MSQEILNEIKGMRAALAKIVGTSEKPEREQFSRTALDKAADRFQKMRIERGEWLPENEIHKCIRNAPYGAGAFIREHFKFKNFFMRGRSNYYNKKDLADLGRELRARNVDLKRYMEFLSDEAKFQKHVESAGAKNKGRKSPPYKLPQGLSDITSSPAKPPASEIIKADIKRLLTEFRDQKFSDYIDIYKKRHAMVKFVYYFEKYLEPGLKSRCAKWCKEFNYANEALREAREHQRKRSAMNLDAG